MRDIRLKISLQCCFTVSCQNKRSLTRVLKKNSLKDGINDANDGIVPMQSVIHARDAGLKFKGTERNGHPEKENFTLKQQNSR